MGAVNVTDDSFSDGGRYLDPARALEHALQMCADGARDHRRGRRVDSTRRRPRGPERGVCRIVPVVKELAAQGITVSIDTMRAAVARGRRSTTG